MANPCTSCGACCATYRVSFYCGEIDELPGGWVPAGLVERVTPVLLFGAFDRRVRGGGFLKPLRAVNVEPAATDKMIFFAF